MFLLDTSVLSHASKVKQHPVVKSWFKRQERIAIPYPAFIEVQQGIFDIARSQPWKAEELARWLQTILDSDYYFPVMTQEVARKTAELYCCSALKNLWYMGEKREKRPGQDLVFAAIAIVHQLPIATFDGVDFSLIDRYHALPGVYDPISDTWLVSPPSLSTAKAEPELPSSTASPLWAHPGLTRRRYELFW